LGRAQRLGGNARFGAAIQPAGGEVGGIGRRGDEQPARILDSEGDDAAQHPVLDDALAGGFQVAPGVAPAGVEQAVIASRGAGGEVELVYQQGAQAAPRQIVEGGGSGRAAADDQHIHRGRGQGNSPTLTEDKAQSGRELNTPGCALSVTSIMFCRAERAEREESAARYPSRLLYPRRPA